MFFMLLLLIFLGVAAGCWFQGLWANAINVVAILLSGLIALNFFEPAATLVESFVPGLTYVFDFLMLWALFALAFGALRGLAEQLDKNWVPFPLPVEMAGRSILALWCGWLMMSFTAFTLQIAPLGAENPLGAWESPTDPTFFGMNPERQWAAFAHSRSRGALARGKFSDAPTHPDDQEADVEAFDPVGNLIYKYHTRRKNLAAAEGLQVTR